MFSILQSSLSPPSSSEISVSSSGPREPRASFEALPRALNPAIPRVTSSDLPAIANLSLSPTGPQEKPLHETIPRPSCAQFADMLTRLHGVFQQAELVEGGIGVAELSVTASAFNHSDDSIYGDETDERRVIALQEILTILTQMHASGSRFFYSATEALADYSKDSAYFD